MSTRRTTAAGYTARMTDVAQPAIDAPEPWEELEALLDTGGAEAVAMFLQLLPPEDTTYTIAHLSEHNQTKMLALLSERDAGLAADLMEHFVDEYAADMIEELEPHQAAAILEEMESAEQTDVLAELDEEDAEAILRAMEPEAAEEARERLEFPHDTAGGLMMSELLSYREELTVDDVLADMRDNSEAYEDHEIRYLYVVDSEDKLAGVLPMRHVPLYPRQRRLRDLMRRDPVSVRPLTPLDDLEDLFDHEDFAAVPVVDENGVLDGVVQESAVREALGERQAEQFLKFGGIIGGEELRGMPLHNRWVRRMAFLMPNVVLSCVSISIIALFQDVIDRVVAVAVFLPLVANVSGAAGNQAVAVSIRELSLGMVAPRDVWRVVRKEAGVGVLNGLAIGLVVGFIVLAGELVFNFQGPISRYALAGLFAGVFALNSILAVCLGGGLPLVLRRLGVDPAMVSSPVLTTVTDMGAFFLTLSFTALALATSG